MPLEVSTTTSVGQRSVGAAELAPPGDHDGRDEEDEE
jgi:hypothetical protein